MANENTGQKNGAESTNESSFVDAFFSYLRERLDSPFLFCFLVSWLILNRDFCFYLALTEEANKARVLAGWDFRADIYPWILVPYGNSFILPSIFGAIAAVTFPPVSYLITGLKYHSSAACKHWAKKGKSKFDLQTEISDSEIKLKELKDKLVDHEGKIQHSSSELKMLEESINKTQIVLKNYSYHRLFTYFSNAIRLSNDFRNELTKFEFKDSFSVKPNCLVTVKFSTSNIGICTFSGTVGEFFLDPELNEIEDDFRNKILEIFIDCTVGQAIHFDQFSPGESGSIVVSSAQEFVMQEES